MFRAGRYGQADRVSYGLRERWLLPCRHVYFGAETEKKAKWSRVRIEVKGKKKKVLLLGKRGGSPGPQAPSKKWEPENAGIDQVAGTLPGGQAGVVDLSSECRPCNNFGVNMINIPGEAHNDVVGRQSVVG